MFEPIAIVGRACVLPGALSPEALWRQVETASDLIRSAPPGYWGLDADRILTPGGSTAEMAFTDKGGYVSGFDEVFDATAWDWPAGDADTLDPIFHWLLYVAKQALADAGVLGTPPSGSGLIIGNLSYPPRGHADFARSVWLDQVDPTVSPRNRFSSGYPVHVVANFLGLDGDAFALDAACASSIYAMKIACDRLHSGDADLMLAGAINKADDLFLHVGFTTLRALSPSGRSRPLDEKADGLLPAEGAGMVALKRLEDAVRAGDRIYGVIRGIGISNDGRQRGFLVPDAKRQVRAMKRAYEVAGINPNSVGYVECHATGTVLGDSVEIESMAEVFDGCEDLRVGSLKSNLGHLTTASGVASLIKVLGAFDAQMLPPTLNVDRPLGAFRGTSIQPQLRAEPWPADRPGRAGINSFGFGGNNAHLIVDAWDSTEERQTRRQPKLRTELSEVAICGIGIVAPQIDNARDFLMRLGMSGGPTRLLEIALAIDGLKFPPNDLRASLPQQMAIMLAVERALETLPKRPGENTGVIVGMGCDGEISRYGTKWRLPELLPESDENRLEALGEALSPELTPAAVIGAMPNVPANRLNSCFDWRGFGYTVSSEELSGLAAIRLACAALRNGEVDTMVVGAVDLSDEPVHRRAAAELLPAGLQNPGDCAVALVLKPLTDAQRDQDTIWAVLEEKPEKPEKSQIGLSLQGGDSLVTAAIGHSHAASGLVHVLAAAISAGSRVALGNGDVRPEILTDRNRYQKVTVESFSGRSESLTLRAPEKPVYEALPFGEVPHVAFFAGSDRDSLARNVESGKTGGGPMRVAIHSPSREKLEESRRAVIDALRTGENPSGADICFAEKPIAGDVAFCFTGAAAAYAGMGREMLSSFPVIGDRIGQMHPVLGPVADRTFAGKLLEEPFAQLKSSGYLCQAHAIFTMEMLGIQADAAIGLSSGETSALFAFGVWRDMAEMFDDIEASNLYGFWGTGRCEAARRTFGIGENEDFVWRNWRILAPVSDVEETIADVDHVFMTIVNSPRDCVIGGAAEACETVLKTVGKHRAIPLGQDMVAHCPALEPFTDDWKRIHSRRTHRATGVRIYSNAMNGSYRPTKASAATALTKQAMTRVDFRRTIENAWKDGVRVFIEHGPHGALTGSIRETLGEREHVAVALDRRDRPDLTQLVAAVAELFVSGVSLDHEMLAKSLDVLRKPFETTSRTSHKLNMPAHLPVFRMSSPAPSRVAGDEENCRGDIEVMQPAPQLPPIGSMKTVAVPLDHPPATPPLHGNAEVNDRVSTIFSHASNVHREFLQSQARVHADFLRLKGEVWQRFSGDTTAASEPSTDVDCGNLECQTDEPRHLSPVEDPAIEFQMSRAELESISSGRVSEQFGPLFRQQDGFLRQVRMPQPPLLLADRVTHLSGGRVLPIYRKR